MRTWMRSSGARLAAIAAVVVGTWIAAPTPRAEAQDASGVLIAVGIPAGVAALGLVTLSVADVVSFATGCPWDDTAAAVELVVGTLVTVLGLGAIVYWAAADQGVPGLAGIGGIVAGLGGLSVAHASWSFATNDPPPSLSVRLAPAQGGVIAGMSATF